MPHRPIQTPLDNDFDSFIAMNDRPVTPRFIVADVGVWNFSKSALVHAHSPPQECLPDYSQATSERPRTSSGVFNRLRAHSLSRPRTSDGGKRVAKESVPMFPSHLHTSVSNADTVNIGIALGSPTAFAPVPQTIVPAIAVKEQQRPKPRRWKTIGSFFGHKRRSGGGPSASVQNSHQRSDGLGKSNSWPVRGTSLHFRSRSRNKSTAAASVLPPIPPFSENQRQQLPLRPGPSTVRRNGSQRWLRRGDNKPVIDVEIPNSGFDRYSVMFSDLWSHPLVSDAPLPTPSLLERRKGETEGLPMLNVRKDSQKTKEKPSRPRAQTDTRTVPDNKSADALPLKRATSARNVQRSASLRSMRSNRSNRSTRSTGKSPSYSLFPKPMEYTPPIPSASTFTASPRPSTSSARIWNVATNTDSKVTAGQADSATSWFSSDEAPNGTCKSQNNPDVDIQLPQRNTNTNAKEATTTRNIYMRTPSAQPLVFPPSPALSEIIPPAAMVDDAPLPSPSLYSARSSGEPHGFHSSHFHSYSRSRSTSDIPSLSTQATYELYLTPPLQTSNFPAPLFTANTAAPMTSAGSLSTQDPSPTCPNSASLTAPLTTQTHSSLSPDYDYDAPHSPLIAVARTVSVSYKHEGKPHFLVRTPAVRNLKASAARDGQQADGERREGRASFQESVVRVRSPVLVCVEGGDVEELKREEEWMRRRSVWGVLVEA